MNKNIIIWVVVVVLVIIGLFILFFGASGIRVATNLTVSENATNTTTTTTTTSTPKGTSKTFASIFTQTGNHQCTYEQVSPSSKATDVIYIADGKMRGEFRTIAPNDNTLTIMIYDGSYLYTWKEGTTAAKRTLLKSISDLPTVIPKDLTSGAVYGAGFDSVGWDCHDWNKDASMLVVPSYLKY